ncbi:hypothetical protein D9M70_632060 [compost metagenome]
MLGRYIGINFVSQVHISLVGNDGALRAVVCQSCILVGQRLLLLAQFQVFFCIFVIDIRHFVLGISSETGKQVPVEFQSDNGKVI